MKGQLGPGFNADSEGRDESAVLRPLGKSKDSLGTQSPMWPHVGKPASLSSGKMTSIISSPPWHDGH